MPLSGSRPRACSQSRPDSAGPASAGPERNRPPTPVARDPHSTSDRRRPSSRTSSRGPDTVRVLPLPPPPRYPTQLTREKLDESTKSEALDNAISAMAAMGQRRSHQPSKKKNGNAA